MELGDKKRMMRDTFCFCLLVIFDNEESSSVVLTDIRLN